MLRAADLISAVEFDHSGQYLATGDHGGRVVLFSKVEVDSLSNASDHRPLPSEASFPPVEFRYLTEFQSHDPEFDYLKSIEIEERINKVKWLPCWQGTGSLSLLTTNDKTIKLWKVYEKSVVSVSEFNLQTASNAVNCGTARLPQSPLGKINKSFPEHNRQPGFAILRVPQVIARETVLSSKCRRSYCAAHAYHINSISLSSDQETFLSADDLRINLWHLDRKDTSFNIVDLKPEAMEDLAEVITCAEFHPEASHIFAYGSSKGTVRLADLRESALCDHHSKMFGDDNKGDGGQQTFFTEIVRSINDLKFIGYNSRHIVTRDYMALKLWDIRMESAPYATYPVQDSLTPHLNELYDIDAIFDKFDVSASADGSSFVTGSYSNFFKVIPNQSSSMQGSEEVLLESSRDPNRRRLAPVTGNKITSRFVGFGRNVSTKFQKGVSSKIEDGGHNVLATDFTSKIKHLSWHPTTNLIATASANALYLFNGPAAMNTCA